MEQCDGCMEGIFFRTPPAMDTPKVEPLKAQVKRWLIQKDHSIMVKSSHAVEYYFFQFD